MNRYLLALALLIILLMPACEELTYDNPFDSKTELNPDDWAPTNLTAEILTDSLVQLSWQEIEKNIDGFRIERKDSTNGVFTEISISDSASYTDTGLVIGNDYNYRVCAYSGENKSSYRDTILVKYWQDCLSEWGGDALKDNCGVCAGGGGCEGIDCTNNSGYCQDLSVLQIFIDNSIETINMDMDDNEDGAIEPLELCEQIWENDRLISFSCHNEGLWGEIPSEIGHWVNLTNLSLPHNQLTGVIPSEIGNLVNLVSLNFDDNNLTGEIPESIGLLTNLTGLYLWGNQLNGEIPESIGLLTNLTVLNLWGNQISGEIPSSIGNLVNLTDLTLSNNELISGEIPPEIGNLVNLTGLSLSATELTGEIPPEIGNLVNLTDLSLGNNELSGEIPSEIGNLENLTYLSLYNNQLTGAIPTEIGNLVNLTSL